MEKMLDHPDHNKQLLSALVQIATTAQEGREREDA